MYWALSDKEMRRQNREKLNEGKKTMKCPECKSDHINKNGHRGQKKNYICVNCGRQFIDGYETKGYRDDVKRTCLKM